MPSPQNQLPKRVGSGAPVSASAVPLSLSRQSNSGSATVTAPPASIPRSARRLVHSLVPLMSALLNRKFRRTSVRAGNDLRARYAVGKITRCDLPHQLDKVVVTGRKGGLNLFPLG